MLEKLKNLFKIVNFSGSLILKDGTEVLLDGGNMEVGVKCFVSLPNAEEPIALPDGEYTCEDDSTLVVKDGMIADIIAPKPEETIVEEAEVEVEEEMEIVVQPEDNLPETTGTTETIEPVDLEKKVSDLESRLSILEEMLNQKTETIKQSSEKLESDFQALKEKLETTDGATKLASQKIQVALTPAELRYKAMKANLK